MEEAAPWVCVPPGRTAETSPWIGVPPGSHPSVPSQGAVAIKRQPDLIDLTDLVLLVPPPLSVVGLSAMVRGGSGRGPDWRKPTRSQGRCEEGPLNETRPTSAPLFSTHGVLPDRNPTPVSYTHLTLPTTRIV